ncbi:MAG: Na+/H+ antiporter [Segniliparus sp.]|uniref:Na+/H+ antiporter n=1 Tax=Segniliparus sp. TaxID=2804064 RepID=UPI003F413570
MFELELVVTLGLAVLIGSIVARRLNIAPPIVLLCVGAALAAVPAFAGVTLPSEVMLFIFLPALLYWESLTSSLREIRAYVREIALTSTLLVVLTAAAVAYVAHALALPWAPACVLGAALAPTDATAISTFGRALPARGRTILCAESLFNDGIALVLYALAVTASTGAVRLSALTVGGLVVLSFVGGVGAGLLVGWAAFHARRRISDPVLGSVAMLLTPFLAYLLAEAIHASGVLAVVTCGFYLAQIVPKVLTAQIRQQTQAFWTFITFLLNGGIFVFVGLALPGTVHDLKSVALERGVLLAVACYATLVATRLAFFALGDQILWLFDRKRTDQGLLRPIGRSCVVSTVAGFRGAVSLAVALAVPVVVADGGEFAARDLIVFVTAAVVAATTLVQGLLLPSVIRWAKLPADESPEERLQLAQRSALEEALAALPEIACDLHIDDAVAERVQMEYETRLDVLHAEAAEQAETNPGLRQLAQYTDLRLALLEHKRETLLRLHKEQEIDETVLRRARNLVDSEEIWLSRP